MNNSSSNLTSIDLLIAPITGSEEGVGEDLTFDPRIDAINAARIEDDPLLAQGDWVTDLKVADWDFVVSECSSLLCDTSKDLKVALWYIDALSHTNHLAGIIHGLKFLISLNQTYWAPMFPSMVDEGSMDIRAGLYSWFVKALTEDLHQISLSDSGDHNYNTYLSARNHDKQRQQNPDLVVEGLTLADYHQAVRSSNVDWQKTLISQFNTLQELWNTVTDQLNELMGQDAPVFAPVTDLIKTISAHLAGLLPQIAELDDQSADSIESEFSDNHGVEGKQSVSVKSRNFSDFNPSSQNHQANRQQALKLLGQIQTYFASNEPHSPVTFLLKRAIDWADMPLDQWLTHVIKNEDQLKALSEIIGINNQAEDQNENSY